MDERAQQELDELQAHLWFCLTELRPFISPALFAQAERDIGMNSVAPLRPVTAAFNKGASPWH
jgi:hypothetical protein